MAQKAYLYSFKKAFLSDPSTYPLIIIMGAAGFLLVGMSANALLTYKNVRISPEHKHEIIPTGGDQRHDTLTSKLTKRPIAMHADAFKDIRYEGLGVDHENWKKDHKDYKDYTKKE